MRFAEGREFPPTRQVAGLVFGVAVLLAIGYAANPASGSVSENNPVVNWTGPILPATAEFNCFGPNDPACDNFRLTIVPPSPAFGPYIVDIQLTPEASGDWDLHVFDPDGVASGSSGNSPGQVERIVLNNPRAGTWTVAAAPFAPTVNPVTGNSYTAFAEMAPKPVIPPPPPGGEDVTYANFVPPSPLGRPSSAESNIGVCSDNRILYLGSLDTYRLSLDECSSPPEDAWEDVSFLLTSTVTLDPILFTDRVTNRTFVSQLSGKTSLMAFSDDCGDSWTPSQGAGINSGVDHQTVGGGPYNQDAFPPPPPPTVYPHAVYYCSQDVVTAQCARSDNGGLTFGPAVPIYNLTECGGLHGHLKVSPDGIVYVPNGGCNGVQAVVVSEDNGLTWEPRPAQDAAAGEFALPGPLDPSVGIASDGTVYFGWSDSGSAPRVAVSTDRGLTWSNFRDVANGFGVPLNNVIFPAMVAGDPDRAALAFYGAFEPDRPAGSGAADDPAWPGDWYLYVAHTYDGGDSWTTVNAAPDDPVQRATICPFGVGCENGTRNLLDFMDANIDREGRVVVGYQDGCVGGCVKDRPNSFSAVATVARQVNGRRMFAEFDVLDVPGAPAAEAFFDAASCAAGTDPQAVLLSWTRPDDHGSTITEYRVYRRTEFGSFSQLAVVAGDVNSYTDSTIVSGETYFYQVTAVNAVGESPACGEIEPGCGDIVVQEDPCEFPGVTVLEDELGDHTLADPTQRDEYDIEKLWINERPELGPGKIEFVLKMVSMANPPPDSTWPVVFRSSDGNDYFVRMTTDAVGNVGFAYGPGTNPGTLATAFPADPQSGFNAEGFIRIVVDRANIGNPAPADALTMFLVRVRIEGVAVSPTPDNMPSSLARSGQYDVFGSENCDVVNFPDAVDDSASTLENNPVVINVLANDSDGGSPPLTVVAVSDPPDGTTTNNNDGTVTYRPDTNFTGPDNFTYTVRNGDSQEDTATVTVTVDPAPPVARDDEATTKVNRPIRIDVVANDSTNHPPLTVTEVSDPANGSVVNNGDGTVTYMPDLDFEGTDGFEYTVCDSNDLCSSAVVTVFVEKLDDDDSDDDDFDDDGSRDDHDSDDDNDGIPDDDDSDDDNDGISDDHDSDDDNDGIDDEFDSQSSREEQWSEESHHNGGSSTDYVVETNADSLLVIAAVEAPSTQFLVVEIYDPSGTLVAASIPAPGRIVASTVPTTHGTYTVRVRNTGSTGVDAKTILIRSTFW